jgi:hypothetical protein
VRRIALALAFLAIDAWGAECTKAQAIAAEGEASSLKTWSAVHRSFRTYAHCDDGAIGEGYSESITLLLANRWNTLPSLARLAASDPKFERFVMRHVDATVPKERLARISAHAKHRCPKGQRPLCRRLLEATK